MRTKITFYEFDGFELDEGIISDRIEQTGLTAEEIRYLDWFSQKHSSKNSPVFQITPSTIRARQFVGTICIGSKEIQVLPKLLKGKDEEGGQLLQNLISMLEYVNQLEGIDSGMHKLAQHTGSFIEIYIRAFAGRLLRLIQRNTPRSYVTSSGSLDFVKGRILFSENIKVNATNQAKVFCEYDEFIEDNIFNQTFKYVAESLSKITSVSDTKKALVRSVSLLSDVKLRSVSFQEVRNVSVPDRSRELSETFALAKMFLRYLSSDIYGGSAKSVAVLIDMNELFESFVFNILNRNSEQLKINKVTFQRGRRLVSGVRELGNTEFESRSMFNTFQDILLDFSTGRRLVIDTKYKLVGSNGQPHFGISGDDVYQILAYREISGSQDNESSVSLFYPENKERMRLEFKINSENDVRFSAATLNIGFNMQGNVMPLVEEMRGIFESLGVYKV